MAAKRKVICPHCGQLKAYRHQAHCNQNPESFRFRGSDAEETSRDVFVEPAGTHRVKASTRRGLADMLQERRRQKGLAPRTASRSSGGSTVPINFCYGCGFDLRNIHLQRDSETEDANEVAAQVNGVYKVNFCPMCRLPLHRVVVK